jgi:hypothetical protein
VDQENNVEELTSNKNSFNKKTMPSILGIHDVKTVKKMLKEGADLEEESQMGATALWMSIVTKNIPLTKFLLSKKAKTHWKNTSALNEAVKTDLVELFDVVVEYDQDIQVECDSPIIFQVSSVAMAQRMDRLKIDWNEGYGIFNSTILMLACTWMDNKEIVTWLIEEKNVDVNKTNNQQCTALHLAIDTCNLFAIKYLLRAGASIEIKDRDGDSAVAHASGPLHTMLSNKISLEMQCLWKMWIRDEPRTKMIPQHRALLKRWDEESFWFYTPKDIVRILKEIVKDKMQDPIPGVLKSSFNLVYNRYVPRTTEALVKMKDCLSEQVEELQQFVRIIKPDCWKYRTSQLDLYIQLVIQ